MNKQKLLKFFDIDIYISRRRVVFHSRIQLYTYSLLHLPWTVQIPQFTLHTSSTPGLFEASEQVNLLICYTIFMYYKPLNNKNYESNPFWVPHIAYSALAVFVIQ